MTTPKQRMQEAIGQLAEVMKTNEMGDANTMGVKNQSQTPEPKQLELEAVPASFVHPSTENVLGRIDSAERLVADTGSAFVNGRPDVYYDNNLMGIPFLFASGVVWRTDNGDYGEQECACVAIQFFDTVTGVVEDTVYQARLKGGYIRNSLKRMTENDMFAYPYTILRNPAMETNVNPKTGANEHPRTLAVWVRPATSVTVREVEL